MIPVRYLIASVGWRATKVDSCWWTFEQYEKLLMWSLRDSRFFAFQQLNVLLRACKYTASSGKWLWKEMLFPKTNHGRCSRRRLIDLFWSLTLRIFDAFWWDAKERNDILHWHWNLVRWAIGCHGVRVQADWCETMTRSLKWTKWRKKRLCDDHDATGGNCKTCSGHWLWRKNAHGEFNTMHGTYLRSSNWWKRRFVNDETVKQLS